MWNTYADATLIPTKTNNPEAKIKLYLCNAENKKNMFSLASVIHEWNIALTFQSISLYGHQNTQTCIKKKFRSEFLSITSNIWGSQLDSKTDFWQA
jgi:hypothetical protein